MTDSERITKWVAETLEQSKDFAIAQAPDVVQQFLAWKLSETCAVMAFQMMFVVAVCLVAWRFWRSVKNSRDMDKDDREILAWLIFLVFFVLAASAMRNMLVAVQLWFTPKAYLIQYALRG